MRSVSSTAIRHSLPKAEVIRLLACLKDSDTADDVLMACLSEAADLSKVSHFTQTDWVALVSRLSGKDSDLLPPVEMRNASCPDIPDHSNELSASQDDIGRRLFNECSTLKMTSVQAAVACLMVATVAAEACGLTRRAWKEYARKVWELWNADAMAVGGE